MFCSSISGKKITITIYIIFWTKLQSLKKRFKNFQFSRQTYNLTKNVLVIENVLKMTLVKICLHQVAEFFYISLQHQLLLQLLRLDSDRSLRLINDSSRLLRQLLQQLDRLSPCGRRKWPRQRPQQLAHGLSKLFGLNPFLVAPKFGQIWTTNFRSHRPLVLKLFSWI